MGIYEKWHGKLCGQFVNRRIHIWMYTSTDSVSFIDTGVWIPSTGGL